MPACIEVYEINREYFVSNYRELLRSHLQQRFVLTGVGKRFLILNVRDRKPLK